MLACQSASSRNVLVLQVYCGNLDYDEKAQDVERLFDEFGPIERMDMKTGEAHACESAASDKLHRAFAASPCLCLHPQVLLVVSTKSPLYCHGCRVCFHLYERQQGWGRRNP